MCISSPPGLKKGAVFWLPRLDYNLVLGSDSGPPNGPTFGPTLSALVFENEQLC